MDFYVYKNLLNDSLCALKHESYSDQHSDQKAPKRFN